MSLQSFAGEVVQLVLGPQRFKVYMRGRAGVYGLLDPLTARIRYVGRSSNIEARLYQHCRENDVMDRSPKSEWMRGLRKTGQYPSAQILELFPRGMSKMAMVEAEARWIQRAQPDLNVMLTRMAHPHSKDSQSKRERSELLQLRVRVEQLEKELSELKGNL